MFAILPTVAPISAAYEQFTGARFKVRLTHAVDAAAKLESSLRARDHMLGGSGKRELWLRIARGAVGTGLASAALSTGILLIDDDFFRSGWRALIWFGLIGVLVALTTVMGALGVLEIWERHAIEGGRIKPRMHGILVARLLSSAVLSSSILDEGIYGVAAALCASADQAA